LQPLEGPHHFTGITAHVEANVDFWARVMGLRHLGSSVNVGTPSWRHTYFGDEKGSPGSLVTFLELEDAGPGRPGRGDVHRLVLRVGSYDSLEWWMDRLIANETHSEMLRLDPTQPDSLVFHDPDGHEVELMASDSRDAPLTAAADDIPDEHRVLGIEGARSYVTLEEQLPCAEHLGFRPDGDRLVLDGSERGARWYFSSPPDRPSGTMHAGVWHHVALAAGDHAELRAWRAYADTGPVRYSRAFDHCFSDSCQGVSPGGCLELCPSVPAAI
jgi:glyoxalase family protein